MEVSLGDALDIGHLDSVAIDSNINHIFKIIKSYIILWVRKEVWFSNAKLRREDGGVATADVGGPDSGRNTSVC